MALKEERARAQKLDAKCKHMEEQAQQTNSRLDAAATELAAAKSALEEERAARALDVQEMTQARKAMEEAKEKKIGWLQTNLDTQKYMLTSKLTEAQDLLEAKTEEATVLQVLAPCQRIIHCLLSSPNENTVSLFTLSRHLLQNLAGESESKIKLQRAQLGELNERLASEMAKCTAMQDSIQQAEQQLSEVLKEKEHDKQRAMTLQCGLLCCCCLLKAA